MSPASPFHAPAAARRALADGALAALAGVLAGTGGAGFLLALDAVTAARFAQPWLLALLPLAGLISAWAYRRAGGPSGRGHNLIIEEIHTAGGGVPLRMAPLVTGASLLTHLCGGSAGREGTGVQMGGALAGGLARALGLDGERRSTLLSAGVAGGFGAIFGTPLAGAVFAREVLVRGRLSHHGLGACLVAALTGDLVCTAWGAHHADLATLARLGEWTTDGLAAPLAQSALVGLAAGLVARLFVAAARAVTRALEKIAPAWWLKPILGGLAVGGLALALGTDVYLGLGTAHPDPAAPSLLTLFSPGGAAPADWLWKLLFTAVTIGAGFKGGEVTPLFFIGAALGHVLGPLAGLPIAPAAALGFVAVFAGASKTPLACTLLGVELFGGEHAALFGVACLTAFLAGGRDGIYEAQR